jgi:hypothetical protein
MLDKKWAVNQIETQYDVEFDANGATAKKRGSRYKLLF